MRIVDKIKAALSEDADTEKREREGEGVVYQCEVCGNEFDTAEELCPDCGASAIVERNAFELRPDQ